MLKKKTANKHCSEHGRHRSTTSNWYIIGSREYPQPPTTAVQEEPGNVDGEENEDVVMGWREEGSDGEDIAAASPVAPAATAFYYGMDTTQGKPSLFFL